MLRLMPFLCEVGVMFYETKVTCIRCDNAMNPNDMCDIVCYVCDMWGSVTNVAWVTQNSKHLSLCEKMCDVSCVM